jgi:hypothetical protein
MFSCDIWINTEHHLLVLIVHERLWFLLFLPWEFGTTPKLCCLLCAGIFYQYIICLVVSSPLQPIGNLTLKMMTQHRAWLPIRSSVVRNFQTCSWTPSKEHKYINIVLINWIRKPNLQREDSLLSFAKLLNAIEKQFVSLEFATLHNILANWINIEIQVSQGKMNTT